VGAAGAEPVMVQAPLLQVQRWRAGAGFLVPAARLLHHGG
jgi:hypothetical protein